MTTRVLSSVKEFSRNPLGIIALFIVLVYGFASYLFSSSVDLLNHCERMWIIVFIVLFPIIVLVLFGWLVVFHHDKLYAPSDFKDDNSFLKTIKNPQFNSEKASMVINELGNNSNTETTTLTEQRINDLINVPDFETINVYEQNIIDDMKNKNLQIDTNDTIKMMLIKQLAMTQFATWVEHIYSFIFGSQLKLLEKGASNTSSIIDNSYIDEIFSETKKINSDVLAGIPLDVYLEYLYKNLLIEKNSNGLIKITTRGKDFMKAIYAAKYSLTKLL